MAIENWNSLGNSWQAKLPSVHWLRQRYSFYRTECFDNLVPPVEQVTIQWNERMVGPAGKCWTYRKLIQLSPHYFLKYPNSLEGVFRHEMIHLLVHGHPPKFYEWLRILEKKGYPTPRFANEVSKASWLYSCQNCGQEWPRTRKWSLPRYCKSCGPQFGSLVEEKIEYQD